MVAVRVTLWFLLARASQGFGTTIVFERLVKMGFVGKFEISVLHSLGYECKGSAVDDLECNASGCRESLQESGTAFAGRQGNVDCHVSCICGLGILWIIGMF